jgi:hypothetical protein
MVDTPDQIHLHTLLSKLFLLSSIPTYLVTRYVTVAPFGRHVPDATGGGGGRRWKWFGTPAFDAKVSWSLFECPNLFWVWYYFFFRRHHRPSDDDSDVVFHRREEGSSSSSYSPPAMMMMMMASSPPTTTTTHRGMTQPSTNVVLASLFALHYVNRAVIYPMRMNPKCQKVPLLVTVCAATVTTLNGYLQCSHLAHDIEMHPPLTRSLELGNVVRWAGVCLFFAGMAVNVMSDEVLRNLRRDDNNAPAAARPPAAAAAEGKERDGTTTAANEGRDGTTTTTKDGTEEEEEEAQHHHNRGAYYVPRSPLFAIVSCPNFLGEIIEWFGYSMASTFSLPSVAFFAYTACNLIPRAVAHHEWYLRKFDDYPIERKWAVIPLVV